MIAPGCHWCQACKQKDYLSNCQNEQRLVFCPIAGCTCSVPGKGSANPSALFLFQSRSALREYSASVAARGMIHSNKARAFASSQTGVGFKPLHKPQWLLINKKVQTLFTCVVNGKELPVSSALCENIGF